MKLSNASERLISASRVLSPSWDQKFTPPPGTVVRPMLCANSYTNKKHIPGRIAKQSHLWKHMCRQSIQHLNRVRQNRSTPLLLNYATSTHKPPVHSIMPIH